MTDLQGAWIFVVLLLVVISVLDLVIQAFALHSALARAKHVPKGGQLAGIGLFALWFPTVAVWIIGGIAMGMRQTPARCTSADVSAIWLGLTYPLTAWPAALQARRGGVRLSVWYWILQAATGLALVVLGGFPCL